MGRHGTFFLGAFITFIVLAGGSGCMAPDDEGETGIDPIDPVSDTGIVEQQIGEQ